MIEPDVMIRAMPANAVQPKDCPHISHAKKLAKTMREYSLIAT